MIKDIKEHDKFIDRVGQVWTLGRSTVIENGWFLYEYPECPSMKFSNLKEVESYLNSDGFKSDSRT